MLIFGGENGASRVNPWIRLPSVVNLGGRRMGAGSWSLRAKRGNLKKYLALEVLDFAGYLFRRFTPGCPQEDCLFFFQISNLKFLLSS